MGLFDFFKRKQSRTSTNRDNKVLLSMPMYCNGERYELKNVVETLQRNWNLNVINLEGNNDTATFEIQGELYAIAFIPQPIPLDDIESTANFAYNWPTALKDLKDFSGHAIVTSLSSSKTTLKRYILLTKVLYSILKSSNAIGIYQGRQTLLLPKNQYLDNAEELLHDGLPISLWVYIGMRKSNTGNSIYTYGLQEFDKHELEVVDSKLSLEELFDFIVNISLYVIGKDVVLNDGETLGYTADHKVNISLSKGHFVEGNTLKLEL